MRSEENVFGGPNSVMRSSESSDFVEIRFEKAPKCLICVHFPDCFEAFANEPDFRFRIDCERFEEGDWIQRLRLEKTIAEKKVGKGEYEEEIEIYDGKGNLIERKVEKTFSVRELLER